MNMDVAKGIYNLRIHNVQMDDEAEYQCQVTLNVILHINVYLFLNDKKMVMTML